MNRQKSLKQGARILKQIKNGYLSKAFANKLAQLIALEKAHNDNIPFYNKMMTPAINFFSS